MDLGPVAGASGSITESWLAYLPDVEDVVGLPVYFVSVEHQIAVSPIEEAIPLMFHRDQLQVFNSPDLGTRGDTRLPRERYPVQRIPPKRGWC